MKLASKVVQCLVIGACLGAGAAWGKLPPLSEEQKAKAAEAKVKAAEATKKQAEALAQAQDRVAERYIREQRGKGVEVKPVPISPAAPPGPGTPPAPLPDAQASPKK